MDAMPRPRPPHLQRERTRHGTVVWYVRREHGSRIRLRAAYDTPEFWIEYRAALDGKPKDAPAKPKAHSLRWAIDRYRKSSAWTALAHATRKQRASFLTSAIDTAGDAPLQDIDQDSIRAGRERRSDRPHAANNFLKAMRGFFGWAVGDGLIAFNPTIGVKLLKGRNDEIGFHTWTEAEIELFEARWPVGTRERLAFDVLLYTGLRRGDAVRLGRQHVRDGFITVRTEKGGEEVTLPLLAPLSASIAAAKTGDLTYIVTERGTAFVKESFGTWFREACRLAGCPGSAHGLRKAAATRVAEGGASTRQLMAIFGWSTEKMASHYTRAADRRRLSKAAASMMLPTRTENEDRPHLEPGAGENGKKQMNSGA